jgi:hypothetical protein
LSFWIFQKILYQGKLNSEIVESIRNSTLADMPFEGVVAKSALDRKTKLPLLFKIKTNAWLDKLKTKCGDDVKLFEELA